MAGIGFSPANTEFRCANLKGIPRLVTSGPLVEAAKLIGDLAHPGAAKARPYLEREWLGALPVERAASIVSNLSSHGWGNRPSQAHFVVFEYWPDIAPLVRIFSSPVISASRVSSICLGSIGFGTGNPDYFMQTARQIFGHPEMDLEKAAQSIAGMGKTGGKLLESMKLGGYSDQGEKLLPFLPEDVRGMISSHHSAELDGYNDGI